MLMDIHIKHHFFNFFIFRSDTYYHSNSARDTNICNKQPCITIVNIHYSGNNTAVTRSTHDTLIFYICLKLAKKIGIAQCLKRRYKSFKRCVEATRPTSEVEEDVETESDTGSLPDRLINPEEYEPVLPTTEEHPAAELTADKEQVPRRMIAVYTYNSIN